MKKLIKTLKQLTKRYEEVFNIFVIIGCKELIVSLKKLNLMLPPTKVVIKTRRKSRTYKNCRKDKKHTVEIKGDNCDTIIAIR